MGELCHLAAEKASLRLCQMKVALKSRSWCPKGLIPSADDSLVCADMTFEGMILGNQQLWWPAFGNYWFRWPWWHVNFHLTVCSVITWPWHISISPVGTNSPPESRWLLSGSPGYPMSTVCPITQFIATNLPLEILWLSNREESDRGEREVGGQREQSTNCEGMEIREIRPFMKKLSYFTAVLTLWDCWERTPYSRSLSISLMWEE